MQSEQPSQNGFGADFDFVRESFQSRFITCHRSRMIDGFREKLFLRHKHCRSETIADSFQQLVFRQLLAFQFAGLVSSIFQEDMDELVQQCENSAVWCVRIVQENYG